MMAWLNSPEMARHATRLGAVLRFDTMFSAKHSEIAILVTARHWTSHYEWFAHKRLALAGGLDPKIVDGIRGAKSLYDDAVKMFGERGIVEIIGLCGFYTLVSMTLNTFEFGLPEGQVS